MEVSKLLPRQDLRRCSERYGNVAPMTREGRVFCIFYCCVGIPLMLVTMADLAKFMSSGLLFAYVRYLKLKQRVRQEMTKRLRKASGSELNGSLRNLNETEGLLFTNFDRVSFVQLHATVILFILCGYICLGGEAFHRIELWQYVESLYFTFVSILTIGFGDMLPWNKQYHWFTVFYVFLGKIHQLGKSVQQTNYIDLIHRMQKIKERREKFHALKSVAKVAMAIQFVSGKTGTLK
ncbi:unnamed protein product [Soboliphyme baturini]|uniref:Ion_trans_2 domain-containing protein n=1 Tax=Soboliphyme baturini TaxID=241478 RepID=A0A183J1F9_9BILA|nr:unnamed protein product [Soboliphyme baturini]